MPTNELLILAMKAFNPIVGQSFEGSVSFDVIAHMIHKNVKVQIHILAFILAHVSSGKL